MKANITKIYGVLPHPDTSHLELNMQQLVGVVCYEAEFSDGTRDYFETGIRPGENNAWNREVIRAAQVWRNAGGLIPEWTQPTVDELREMLPMLTSRQIRLGIISSGRSIDRFETAIYQIENEIEREKILVEWQYATAFSRSHPVVNLIASELDFSQHDLDVLWQAALQL